MKLTESWINDWKVGVAPAKERGISSDLLGVFQEFWDWADLQQRSKSTQQRYSNALHALGGWAVEEVADGKAESDAHRLLAEATAGGEAPLIFMDREEWQKELDTVCRKLWKFLGSRNQ